ncbi:unnamed protein product, partial [Prorocentrum cordatum]
MFQNGSLSIPRGQHTNLFMWSTCPDGVIAAGFAGRKRDRERVACVAAALAHAVADPRFAGGLCRSFPDVGAVLQRARDSRPSALAATAPPRSDGNRRWSRSRSRRCGVPLRISPALQPAPPSPADAGPGARPRRGGSGGSETCSRSRSPLPRQRAPERARPSLGGAGPAARPRRGGSGGSETGSVSRSRSREPLLRLQPAPESAPPSPRAAGPAARPRRSGSGGSEAGSRSPSPLRLRQATEPASRSPARWEPSPPSPARWQLRRGGSWHRRSRW